MKESFRDFMWRALYHPERGYYSRRITNVGARGDFSTSASLNASLAHAIARWIVKESRTTGVTDVIEVGGGDGSLMEAVRYHLGWWQRLRFRFHLVEISSSLKQLQAARLGTKKVQWHTMLQDALQQTNGRGLIYHNELMDAFPVELVQFDPTTSNWHQVAVRWENGLPTEEISPLRESPESFSVLPTRPTYRQRAELGTDLHAWFSLWLPQWHSGAMLGIDYGDTLPQLYHRRPNGTLRGYLLQQRVEGPSIYENIGRQDLTADVNFTDVMVWLKQAKQAEPNCETQGSFIQRMGVPPSPGQASADQAFKCITLRL